jgi:hypothetical protein
MQGLHKKGVPKMDNIQRNEIIRATHLEVKVDDWNVGRMRK